MTAVTNPGFESAGVAQGSALGWSSTFVCTAVEIATYGQAGEVTPWDGFEGSWSNDTYAFALDGASPRALYGPPAAPLLAESFEKSWHTNKPPVFTPVDVLLGLYFFELVDDIEEVFQASPPESFEVGWTNVPFLVAFAPGDVLLGPSESFESSWGVDGFLFDGTTITTAAVFASGNTTHAWEDFEASYAPRLFSADPATNRITPVPPAPWGLFGDYVIVFPGTGENPTPGTGTLPTPLSADAGKRYSPVIVFGNPNLLALAEVGSGTLITFSDVGSGAFYLTRDPASYWVSFLP